MTDTERDLRDMMRRAADEVHHVPPASRRLVRRARLGRARSALIGGMAVVALVIGGFAGVRSLTRDEGAFVGPPSNEVPMRNGPILQADAGYWLAPGPPPPPSEDRAYTWNAFDHDTGWFLYNERSDGRVWVVGKSAVVAEFRCPLPSGCGDEMAAFGPGPDEITVPTPDSSTVRVVGFDGSLRETIDISGVVAPGQDLSDLAWSPDGTRLGVSTEFELGSSCVRAPCGTVWIVERDGSAPKVRYTEGVTGYAVLRDLAWSPDGSTLAVLQAPSGYCSRSPEPVPRLIALRMQEPERARVLYRYDNYAVKNVCVVADDYHLAFPFVWSPDGTRLAVTSGRGIAEISADDGDVLARHPGGPDGPLAWLVRD